jgi:hypothetical protein
MSSGKYENTASQMFVSKATVSLSIPRHVRDDIERCIGACAGGPPPNEARSGGPIAARATTDNPEGLD